MAPEQKKPSARERAAAAHAAEVAAARRRRQYLIGGIVALVIAAAIGIGIAVQNNNSSNSSAAANGPLVYPAGAVDGGMAIPFGTNPNAKVTLLIYEDFRCPFCKEAESMFNPIYSAEAQAGKILVQYRIVNLIDNNDGGTGSIQAGNAAACAQDVGNAKFKALHDILYANQPAETDDAFSSNATLIGYAKQVPGLDSPAYEACVNSGKYQPWVKKNLSALSSLLNGQPATPYYAINGQQYQLTTQPAATQEADFTAALNKAVAAAG